MGLVKGKLPSDDDCLGQLSLGPEKSFMMMGTPEKDIIKDPSEVDVPDVSNELLNLLLLAILTFACFRCSMTLTLTMRMTRQTMTRSQKTRLSWSRLSKRRGVFILFITSSLLLLLTSLLSLS
jgi:hypothetical protein